MTFRRESFLEILMSKRAVGDGMEGETGQKETRMQRIYIAGPMASSGEPGPNLNRAAQAAGRILEAGHLPWVPHVGWILDAIAPLPRERWLQWGLGWLNQCDAVLRLDGKSVGADAECEFAREMGLEVIESVEEIKRMER